MSSRTEMIHKLLEKERERERQLRAVFCNVEQNLIECQHLIELLMLEIEIERDREKKKESETKNEEEDH